MKTLSANALVWLLLVPLVQGCAESNEATVTGSVKVDGAAPKDGSVSFFPVDGKTYTSGCKIVDGSYTAHVPLGQMRVEIHVPKVVGQRKLYNTPNSPTQDLFEESLPAQYNNESTLQLDVKPGRNEKNYELSTK